MVICLFIGSLIIEWLRGATFFWPVIPTQSLHKKVREEKCLHRYLVIG